MTPMTFSPRPSTQLWCRRRSRTAVRRQQASKILGELSRKMQNPRLAALAMRVRLDSFTRVKKAIDDMVSALMAEKADEIKHKDFCVEEFNTNELETERKDREKQDLIAKIDDLTMQIEELGKAIDTLKSEVAEAGVQLKRGGEDREKANMEFQVVITEQRETQKLLQAALDILASFYGKAFLQQDPPAGFEEYKKNEKSGGVMGMIKTIIADAKTMETEAIRAEENEQKAYEDFVKETNQAIETK